jgi:hypothetical protein
MMKMGQAALKMMWTLTSQSQPSHQKTATFLDLEGVRSGDQYHLVHPTLHIDLIRDWIMNYIAAAYIMTFILIQGLYHGMTSTRAWIYHMYISKHTRQKSLKKYMKSWRSRLARLNDMFDTYIKENFKVVDYQVRTPSIREHDLTWRPYAYHKRRKAMAARGRCIALKSIQIIEDGI